MRIAICLSGLVRTYRQTYENFRDALLTPNENHQLDIFASTWPTEHSNNSMERTRRIAWSGGTAEPFPEESIDYLDIQAKYRPVLMLIEAPKTFEVPWTTTELNVQSFLCMTYKIRSADRLRRQHEEAVGWRYDLVVRARFDTTFPEPVVLDETFDRSSILVPSMDQPQYYPDREWCNDKFAVGPGDKITTYCEWYTNLNSLIARGCPIQPETLLQAHLTDWQVPTRKMGHELPMIRAF
jgi:hypothetical protein